jgi:CHAT domain-containing protein
LKLPHDKAPGEAEALPFDTARAHALYVSLFDGVGDLVKGKHLLVVASGALTTLPFHVLVTEPPLGNDFKAVAWLVRDHPITVLPSVASLASLRRTGRPSSAPKPLIGFANPLLDGQQSHPKFGAWYKQMAERARAQKGCTTMSKLRTAEKLRTAKRSMVSRSPSPVPHIAGIADSTHLRLQAPLPETADEVCDVARSVGADVAEMRIGARATETEVKRLSVSGQLAKYRILHFATHGTLAGQLLGTREPGLILTPPKTSTAEDDGYLSGSEIAGLKLNADWVILSACNTAGGVGKGQAAEALSGLARVFFYAGARALLASHWEVYSEASVKLIGSSVREMTRDSTLGRAEALRRAMLAMVDKGPAHESHPSYWAPFVVVGEGGAK